MLGVPGYADEPLFPPSFPPLVLEDPVLGSVPDQQDSMILRDVGPAFHHPTFVELPVCRSNPNDDGRCLQKIDHLQVAQFEVYVDLLPFYLYILPALANLLVLDRWVVGECLFFRDPPIYH